MDTYSSHDILGSYRGAGMGQEGLNGQYHAQDELYDALDQLQQNASQQAASLDLRDIQSVDQSPFAPGVHPSFQGPRNSVAVPLHRAQSHRSDGGQGCGPVRRSARSSVTASDSAYGSLHVTSGPTPVTFPAFAAQESFSLFQDSNVLNKNFGSGSVVSEPSVADRTDAQGRRPNKRGRSGPPQAPCNICQRPLRNPSDAS